METTPTKGAWNGLKQFFQPLPNDVETFSQGSINSAGGTSPLPGIIPPARPVQGQLDTRTAKSISSVSRAINVISGSLSQLPLDVYRGGDNLELTSLLKKPDVRMTRTEFLALTTGSLATWGNAYWRLHRAVESPVEAVSTIEVLNPELVRVSWDKGRKTYHYGDTKFADWQVKQLMVNPDFEPASNMVMGFGPIQMNRLELQGILDMQRYISNFFINNGVPTGVLSTDLELTAEIATAIRNRWYEVDAFGGIQILPNGLKFQAISLNPEQTQYIMAAQKAITDVARMYGIPANLLLADAGSSMTYSNVQDNSRVFIDHTLMTYAKAIEGAFTEVLPRGQDVKFNFGAFLRGSTKERYETHKIGIDAGFLTVNEARELEDRKPIQGGTPDN
jgi:HK97 family phage portal protein